MRLNAGQMGTEEAEREGDDDDGGMVAMELAAVEESRHKRR